MTMPHLMNCAHDENGWCLDCVEELWSKTQTPPEMLEAATVRYMLSQGHSEKAVKLCRQDNDAAWQNAQRHVRLILEAAGVPALVAEHDAAMAMLAANGIYDTSLTDRISVLLERYKLAQQDAAKGWRAADQYLTDSEKMRILLDKQRQAKRQAECAYDHLTARIAELEQRETRILETIATEGFPLRPDLAQFFNERVEYFTAQESPRDEAVALAWSDYLIETLKRVMK